MNVKKIFIFLLLLASVFFFCTKNQLINSIQQKKYNSQPTNILNYTEISNNQCGNIFIGIADFKLGNVAAPILEDGSIVVVKNQTLKIEIEILGCPIQAWLSDGYQNYYLEYSAVNNIWSAEFKITSVGKTSLEVFAKDIEGNLFSRNINSAFVLDQGQLSLPGFNNQSYEIKLFTKIPTENTWIVADQLQYGFANPIYTSSEYFFLLYPGEYYLEINSSNSVRTFSKIFSVNRLSIINQDIELKENNFLNVLINFINPFEVKITDFYESYANEGLLTAVESHDLTELVIKNSHGKIKIGDIDGKKTLLFVSGLSDFVEDQLKIIKEVDEQLDISNYKLIIISIGSKNSIEKKMANLGIDNEVYELDDINDIETLNIFNSEYFMFLDEANLMKFSSQGVILNKNIILENLNR